MAYSYDHNITRPTGEGISITLPPVVKTNFDLFTDKPGETTYHNLTSPISLQETRKFATSGIANIYDGSGISRAFYGPTVNGIKLYTQCRQTWTAADSSSTTAASWVRPVSGSLSLVLPNDPFLTMEDVLALCWDLVSSLYPDGENALIRFIRGSSRILG